MYFCADKMIAVLCCVLTMFCWGSWANTQKLAGDKWPYKLFYWDYVLGLLLFSIVWGFTVGSTGHNDWSFLANLKAAMATKEGWMSLGSAFLGGVIFNAANILLVVAIAMVGLAMAIPVGCGIALVLGTTVNYLMERKGDPMLIFGGVAILALAIIFSSLAGKKREDAKQAAPTADQKKVSMGKGMAVLIGCGVLMAFFYAFVARTIDTNFTAAAPAAGKLTTYTGFFAFVLGTVLSTFAFNPLPLKKKEGEKRFFADGGKLHLVGILGGCIWSLGTAINYVAAGTAGSAIAFGLGQGATIVSALWGILVWREFKGAPKACALLNAAMFLCFLAGVGLLIKAG